MLISMRISNKNNTDMSKYSINIKFSFPKYKEQNLMKLDFTNYQMELFMILLVTILMRTDMMQ